MRSGLRNFAHVIKVHHRLHRFEQFIINQTTDTEKIILLICVILFDREPDGRNGAVASRTAQAATLKAEKEGLSTVDLEAAKG